MTDVVLDANVFIPKYTRWTLLWVSTTVPAFTPRWSKRILQEAYCNLVLRGLASADEIQAFHRSLVEHFADSWIEQNEIDDLVPTMTNDRKDRHVLAAAALIGSPSVVTSNLADFPTDACERLGVRAARPDDFFAGLVADWSAEIEEALCHYAAVLTNPRPWSLSELLGALARRDRLPKFASAFSAATEHPIGAPPAPPSS